MKEIFGLAFDEREEEGGEGERRRERGVGGREAGICVMWFN